MEGVPCPPILVLENSVYVTKQRAKAEMQVSVSVGGAEDEVGPYKRF